MATNEELETRLAALEERLAVAPLAANPPVTIGELTDVPAPGSAIASAWAQEVTNRIVHRFATKAALDAWAAANGSVGVTADNGVWLRVAGAWQLVTGDRVGFGALNAGQSWLSGQNFPMSWPTESFDTDNFGAGGASITIPAGLSGMYSIAAYIGCGGIAGSPTSLFITVAGAVVANSHIPVGQTSVSVSMIREVSAAEVVQIGIINGHNASMTYSGQVRVLRLTP
jgi:hypothetical protein